MEHSYSNIWFCNWGGFLRCPSDAVSNPLAVHFNYCASFQFHTCWYCQRSGWVGELMLLDYYCTLLVWRSGEEGKHAAGCAAVPRLYCCWRLLQESTYCKCQLWAGQHSVSGSLEQAWFSLKKYLFTTSTLLWKALLPTEPLLPTEVGKPIPFLLRGW